MLLRVWRQGREWTLTRLAEELGLSGRSPSETVRRWEAGESRPDADVIARIEKLTDGAVAPNDMHRVRLDWILSKRKPSCSPSQDAAVPVGRQRNSQSDSFSGEERP